MKVAFVSVRDSFVEEDISYYDGANGRLIQSLLRHFPDMALVTYTDPRHRPYYNHAVRAGKLIALPFKNTFGNGIKEMVRVIRLFQSLDRHYDVLIVQLPFKSFLAPFFLTKPTVYHICSNLRTAAANPVKYKGWRRWTAGTYAELFHWAHLRYRRRTNTRLVAHGNELGRLYGKKGDHVVVSTSIFEEDVLHEDELLPRSEIFNILFVGRPSLEKGFDTLLGALTQLAAEGSKFVLSCVGFDSETFAKTWPTHSLDSLTGHVRFLGEIPFSPALFQQFQEADLMVLPSRSEGTPRVLVEARAFGCPVVATRVGGIPDSIEHRKTGLLFEVGNVAELAESIRLLMHDEDFRHQLRINGLRIVRKKMTLEKFIEPFLQSITELTIDEE